MLFYTGIRRRAHDVLEEQVKRARTNKQRLDQLAELAREVATGLEAGKLPLAEVGIRLHEGWLLKRELSGAVSSPEIDEAYEAGRRAGAWGGKLLGAGGGGCLLFLVEPSRRAALREALRPMCEIPFRFDSTRSRIIHRGGEE